MIVSNFPQISQNSKRTQNFMSALLNHYATQQQSQKEIDEFDKRYGGEKYEIFFKTFIYLLIQKGIVKDDDEFYEFFQSVKLAEKLAKE